MNREKLIRALADDPRVGNPTAAANALDAIEEAIGAELQRNRSVAWRPFGTFIPVYRRVDAAPAEPGKPLAPTVRRVVVFRPGPSLRARVAGRAPEAERRAS